MPLDRVGVNPVAKRAGRNAKLLSKDFLFFPRVKEGKNGGLLVIMGERFLDGFHKGKIRSLPKCQTMTDLLAKPMCSLAASPSEVLLFFVVVTRKEKSPSLRHQHQERLQNKQKR